MLAPLRPSLTLLVLALLPLFSYAATLQTLDGKSYDGDLRIDNGQFLLTPKRGGGPIRLDLNDISLATFKAAEPPKPAQPPPAAQLDRAWKTQDVGPTGTPGSVSFAAGKYAVKGAGSNIKAGADSFYFVYQELRGDGQIIARLADLQIVNPFEKAGVMIRDTFNERAGRTAAMV